MDYFSWLVKNSFGKDTALIMPCLVLTVVLILVGFVIHVALGTIVLTIGIGFWGTILYVFLSDAFRTSYAKYRREKERE